MKELLQYLSFIHRPIFSFVRDVAGFTSKSLSDFLIDIPYNVNKYIRAYQLVNEEKLLMATYHDLFAKLFEYVGKMEASHEILGKYNEAKKKKTQIINLKKIIEEKKLKQEEHGDLDTKLAKAKVKIKELTEQIEKLQEQLSEKERVISPENLKRIKKFDPGDVPSVEPVEKLLIKKVLNTHLINLRRINSALIDTKEIAFVELSKTMKNIGGDLNEMSNKLESGSFEESSITNRLIGRDVFSGTFNLQSSRDWTNRDYDSAYFKEKTQKAIYYHLRRIRKDVDTDKIMKYIKFNLPIRWKENLTSQTTFALDKVKGSCNDRRNLITIEAILRQREVSIRFSKLVGILLNAEEFDKSSRQPGGKYHAEKVFEGRYKQEEYKILNWFRGMRYDGRSFVPLHASAGSINFVPGTQLSSAPTVASILGLRI